MLRDLYYVQNRIIGKQDRGWEKNEMEYKSKDRGIN